MCVLLLGILIIEFMTVCTVAATIFTRTSIICCVSTESANVGTTESCLQNLDRPIVGADQRGM